MKARASSATSSSSTAAAKVKVESNGQINDLLLTYLDVWAKRNGTWQMVHWHSARMPPAPRPRPRRPRRRRPEAVASRLRPPRPRRGGSVHQLSIAVMMACTRPSQNRNASVATIRVAALIGPTRLRRYSASPAMPASSALKPASRSSIVGR